MTEPCVRAARDVHPFNLAVSQNGKKSSRRGAVEFNSKIYPCVGRAIVGQIML